jgi:organic radical activating enzyme
MRKTPRNPFQDRINALNLKDIDEGLRTDSFLKKSHDPIPNDINNQVFSYGDAPPVNVLKPEELSMKDLLDEIQIQTILNNNTTPFVEKKIKSEVTQEMIKDFQNENAKPVNINGTLYKFRPPDLDVKLEAVPDFNLPDKETYLHVLQGKWHDEHRKVVHLENSKEVILGHLQEILVKFNSGQFTSDEYRRAQAHYAPMIVQIDEAMKQHSLIMDGYQKDYQDYDEKKLQHLADVDRITKQNKQNLTAYEDEIKSRNTGMEVVQQEGESDEDYAQRMINTAHTTVDPAQIEIQSKLFLFNTMKDRLGQMIEPWKAEQILNTIIKVDGYEMLQVVKDRWASLQKKLTDTFGDLRRVGDPNSVAMFIMNETPHPSISIPPSSNSPGTLRLMAPPTVIPSPTFIDTPSVGMTQYLTVKNPSLSLYKEPPTRNYLGLPNYSRLPPTIPFQSQFASVRPHPTEIVPYQRKEKPTPNLERVGRRKPIQEHVQKTREETLRIDLITGEELRHALSTAGLKYFAGNDATSKKQNYDLAVENQLLPFMPKLEAYSVVDKMTVRELQEYLDSKGIRGKAGGDPMLQNDKQMLLKMYKRYANEDLLGSGLDIKSRFAIIDGEIQSGNNNPQLMRDAKKLLKEMTQQKMITLYEAQSHMKHLRKINKI